PLYAGCIGGRIDYRAVGHHERTVVPDDPAPICDAAPQKDSRDMHGYPGSGGIDVEHAVPPDEAEKYARGAGDREARRDYRRSRPRTDQLEVGRDVEVTGQPPSSSREPVN